ncbi:MAG TPA: TetR/AcrR family transcriptional regulator [Streptosporangiaceae bacterium]
MPERGVAKGGRYHHGHLRSALIDTAVELIDERGVRGFSLTEASRRLGVAVSAPYAHFTDRDDLLAAVAVHACEVFHAELVEATQAQEQPADRLAAITVAYVRFAAAHRALFSVMFEPGLDKAHHPEIEEAAGPLNDLFLANVRALTGGDEAKTEELENAIQAVAHGYAMLLFDDCPDEPAAKVDQASARAARATLALIESRDLLSPGLLGPGLLGPGLLSPGLLGPGLLGPGLQ